jgi:hypothetical protein
MAEAGSGAGLGRVRIITLAATLVAFLAPPLAAPLAAPLELHAPRAEQPCPPPSENLLFMSCWGDSARLDLALLPEDVADIGAQLSPGVSLRLIITGAYTGTMPREDGKPKPVGLFLRDGQVVSREYGRMDGLLIGGGKPHLFHAERFSLDGHQANLDRPTDRAEFLEHAARARLSALQSHLVIDRGQVDVRPRDGAPSFRRRMLFTRLDGSWGVFDTAANRLTLHEATQALANAHAPWMALNLDMGGFDYCQRATPEGVTPCGALPAQATGKLSNLLILSLE